MTAPAGCAQVREVAPELALGVLGGAPRAEALVHVGSCTRCRAFVGELAETVDLLMVLAPPVEPPMGFEQAATRRLTQPRRSWRRWLTVGAAAASLVAASSVVSVTLVRVVDGRDAGPGRAPETAVAATPVTATLQGEGRVLGRVWVEEGEGAATAWVFLAVDGGLADGDDRVEVVTADGRVVGASGVRVRDGRGAWGGVVEVPAISVGEVRVLDGSERVLAVAELDGVETASSG